MGENCTDIGRPASHLATVAREFGIPGIVDTKNATRLLEDGESVTMVAASAPSGTRFAKSSAVPACREPSYGFNCFAWMVGIEGRSITTETIMGLNYSTN
ncbi:MAG TPA: PEP-utilizing enzyme [Desulfobacterales bacterium]|nr:PEP-utilizing enzyme [Desulfobacterales bacterium]